MPRSTVGSSPTSWRSIAAASSAAEAQPEHFEFATWTLGRSSGSVVEHVLEQRQRGLGLLALVGDVDDLARAGVDRQRDGLGSHGLLVEPAVGGSWRRTCC